MFHTPKPRLSFLIAFALLIALTASVTVHVSAAPRSSYQAYYTVTYYYAEPEMFNEVGQYRYYCTHSDLIGTTSPYYRTEIVDLCPSG